MGEDPREKWEEFAEKIRPVGAYPLWVEWMAFYTSFHSTMIPLLKADSDTLLVFFGMMFVSQRGEAEKYPRLHGVPMLERGRISALSLSQIVGLPRETTRRKLKQLEQMRLVTNHPSGGWTFCDDRGEEVQAWARATLPSVLTFLTRMERLRDRILLAGDVDENANSESDQQLPVSPPPAG